VVGFFRSVQPACVPSHTSGTSQTPLPGRHSVPALPGVNTHTPTPFWTWQESRVQMSLSLQTLVAQGLICGVTVRGVQSHFDPVPACCSVVQDTLWLAFCSQTRQAGMTRSPLETLQRTDTMVVQSTGPVAASRSPQVSAVLGVSAWPFGSRLWKRSLSASG